MHLWNKKQSVFSNWTFNWLLLIDQFKNKRLLKHTHRSVCNAISMRWIWLNAIPRSLSLIYFYFFLEFKRSHTFDTIKFPHFILFHFTSMRADTLNMNLFEKFRMNFLVSAFVSRSLFRIGGLFHRFRNVFCLCFFFSILPNSIAIRLKCRCVCCTAV